MSANSLALAILSSALESAHKDIGKCVAMLALESTFTRLEAIYARGTRIHFCTHQDSPTTKDYNA
ncbi:hypothetical protein [Helicobacter zhangjianzhongii]|uniref:Uncharacterized protein n=1 Tax=Helicobacter zhangjianzhongii TaxID=2974574 RepID=A0ACC6FTE6_9HELI|nr:MULTISPECIES: hypothetical protein [unclassified Helicobacter]MDL0079714.1 hypothetical protein [Helicobacter sp. CPD2-1]MDL0082192.1 hypothetical protein [Helicobacter sp. XJK30-2]